MTPAEADKLTNEEVRNLSDADLANNYKGLVKFEQAEGIVGAWMENEICRRWLLQQGVTL